jgi:hypothetical protein
MSLRIVVILLLLSGTVVGQDTVPIPLTGKNPAPVCRGKGKDAPDYVTPPHAIYAPDPAYPARALKEHVRGFVTLQMVVGVDGLPRDIKAVRSSRARCGGYRCREEVEILARNQRRPAGSGSD